jgi:hypothetical protein
MARLERTIQWKGWELLLLENLPFGYSLYVGLDNLFGGIFNRAQNLSERLSTDFVGTQLA